MSVHIYNLWKDFPEPKLWHARYAHACALTSLLERKAAPTFPKLSLVDKFESLASFAALAIASEHSDSSFVKYEQTL